MANVINKQYKQVLGPMKIEIFEVTCDGATSVSINSTLVSPQYCTLVPGTSAFAINTLQSDATTGAFTVAAFAPNAGTIKMVVYGF